jgi:hypothetical protein
MSRTTQSPRVSSEMSSPSISSRNAWPLEAVAVREVDLEVELDPPL